LPNQTIIAITDNIAAKCDQLDQIVQDFLVARNALGGSYRQYEAHTEALNLFNLTIRNVEGAITLARENLVLLPPAQLAARAAFESSVRAAWIVNVADPFERETRWLAHLKTEEEYLRRIIRELVLIGADPTLNQNRLSSIQNFRQAVSTALEERGYDTTLSMPNFREVVRRGANLRSLHYALPVRTCNPFGNMAISFGWSGNREN
jgi:hypothetical protein